MKIKVLELFGGIGACSKALERLEIDYEIVDYLENNYSIYAENEIEIDLINEIDNLLKEALNET